MGVDPCKATWGALKSFQGVCDARVAQDRLSSNGMESPRIVRRVGAHPTRRIVLTQEGLNGAEMAAYYETTRSFNGNRREVEDALLAVLNSLNLRWLGELSGKDVLTVRVPINDCSWGERIEIQFSGPSTLKVSSKCVFPFQLYDWGKNRRNVLAIVSAMDAELAWRRNTREKDAHFDEGSVRGESREDEGDRYDGGGESQGCSEGREKNGSPGVAPQMEFEAALCILGLTGDATREEIQAAYRLHAKKYHPDQVPLGLADDFRKLAEEKMKLINEAYGVLTRTCD